jgi:hypothetical protein
MRQAKFKYLIWEFRLSSDPIIKEISRRIRGIICYQGVVDHEEFWMEYPKITSARVYYETDRIVSLANYPTSEL